jgi:hypothetical protein
LRRRLLDLLTVLSLLLCVAACVLWVGSYWRSDQLGWDGDYSWHALRATRGHVLLEAASSAAASRNGRARGLRYERLDPGPPVSALQFLYPEMDDAGGRWEWGGASWWWRSNARRGTHYAVAVAPLWALAAAAAVLPLARAAAQLHGPSRRRRRRRRGLCAACGYDLTGNVSGVCPECGGVAP